MNDLHGHAQGDSVICAVAKKRWQFTNSHRLIARYGGEEFILVTFDCDECQLFELSEALRHRGRADRRFGITMTVSGCCYAQVLFQIEGTIEKSR